VPIFEFQCAACEKKFQTLVGMTAEPDDLTCPNCGSKAARRLVSRFARYRHEDDRIDELADKLESMGDPENSGEMRGLMREMGKALDEDASDEIEAIYESDMEAGPFGNVNEL
jgi:putative FmdB family regulatory protein